MAGWIKLHRSLKDSAIADHPEYFSVFVHLLIRAQHTQSECLIGKQLVKLSAGQLVFGRTKFSTKTGVSENKVRSALDVLTKLNMITIKSMSKFSIISIVNWHTYQDESPADHQQITSSAPTKHQQSTTCKNDKNDKNDKNKDLLSENKFSDEDKKCAEWLSEKLVEFIPDCKKPNIDGWAEHVRKMREIDHRDHRDICQIWLWCRKDNFECSNVLSPEKLRKRYDSLNTKMKSNATGANYGQQQKPNQQRGLDPDDTSWADPLFTVSGGQLAQPSVCPTERDISSVAYVVQDSAGRG